MHTITFDAGGADGEMEPVEVEQGSEYALPECGFSIEGGTFGGWTVNTSDDEEPITCQPGEVITVNGDLTLVAVWQIDEEAEETGLVLETEETGGEAGGATLEDDEPSEIGSTFSGAGIAAIIGAVVLIAGAAGVAIAKKKKK